MSMHQVSETQKWGHINFCTVFFVRKFCYSLIIVNYNLTLLLALQRIKQLREKIQDHNEELENNTTEFIQNQGTTAKKLLH